MSEMIKVAVDAMGGDYAPGGIIEGVIEAVNERDNVEVFLVGKEDLVKEELAKYQYPKERIQIVPASEKIETAEPPVIAIRTKKDSSMVVGLNLVKDGKADAFLSAGNSGALLVGGQLIVGKAKGVKRTPLAPVIPTQKGPALLVDCGANVDARPEHLVQFARMGSIYMENVMHVKNPKVGIVNIGAEKEKGNALVKETFPMLKECKDINFVGSVEARDILNGDVDVIVCEAFVGNVVLKLIEGVGLTMLSMVKQGLMVNLRSKIGALLIKPALKTTMKSFDASEYGGAPLLGVKGLVVKCHGNSKKKEIKNGIFQCIEFKSQKINEKIAEKFIEQQQDA